jgi:MTH538 TIR-like domain (DUF1863)
MSSLTSKGLGGLVPGTTLTSVGSLESSQQSGLGSLLGNALFNDPPPTLSLLGGLLRDISPSPPSLLGGARHNAPPPPPHNELARAIWGDAPLSSLGNAFLQPETKRKAYFAFRFEDIMRVNNVRKAWCIDHPDSPMMRSFWDRSIWEKSKAREPESLKALMRGAVRQSSAICVLVGTNTWKGPWVKYEIARAVADKRGLLAVHINGLNYHERRTPDQLGYSPLHCMGVFHSPNGCYYIYEKFVEVDPQTGQLGWAWRRYEDFKDAVELPHYIPSLTRGRIAILASYTCEYDYVGQNGHGNIGAWIDRAAAAVGR